MIYTHATWRVRPEETGAFIAAWDRLASLFSALPAPPHWGTLLRSRSEPQLFYSFGPWNDSADIEAMRGHPDVQAAFVALGELCEEMTPGSYDVVRHVQVRAPA